MASKKAKSFNTQVFEKTYTGLNLSSTERIIFFRLLGFLIRNKKPFPYSAVALSKLTGFHKRTIFSTLNKLEKYRLIERIEMGKNRRFCPGSILNKILTTVQTRMVKYLTTVQYDHQKLTNSDPGAYNKTSLSLKHKEKGFVFISEKATTEQIQNIIWYLNNLKFEMPHELEKLIKENENT